MPEQATREIQSPADPRSDVHHLESPGRPRQSRSVRRQHVPAQTQQLPRRQGTHQQSSTDRLAPKANHLGEFLDVKGGIEPQILKIEKQ